MTRPKVARMAKQFEATFALDAESEEVIDAIERGSVLARTHPDHAHAFAAVILGVDPHLPLQDPVETESVSEEVESDGRFEDEPGVEEESGDLGEGNAESVTITKDDVGSLDDIF
jgi:hypothetical protein